MRITMQKVSLIVLVALVGCGDMTNISSDADTGTDYDDMDNDGQTDGWDQDEVLGPMAQYPGEIDINVGALSIPWFEGDALTAICRHELGEIVELHWGYLLGEEYADTWLVVNINDRLPEGSAVCGLTQNGEPLLDIHQTDVLVWSSKTLCVHQGADGVYTKPSYSECDGMRPPW